MADQFAIMFRPSGRGKAQCGPDPKYPTGIDISLSPPGAPSCTAKLPYPAPECGIFIVKCQNCPQVAAVTAAGRADDPRQVTIPCPVKARSN